jgi:hypothetical protein
MWIRTPVSRNAVCDQVISTAATDAIIQGIRAEVLEAMLGLVKVASCRV